MKKMIIMTIVVMTTALLFLPMKSCHAPSYGRENITKAKFDAKKCEALNERLAVQVGSPAASEKPAVTVTSNKKKIAIKWTVSQKDKVKKAQIQYGTKKSMKNAQTVTLSKSMAKKQKYKLEKAVGEVQSGKTYYIRVRVKVGNKWTKWSTKQSAKLKQSEKKTTEEKKEEEDGIINANGTMLNVISYDDTTAGGLNNLFSIYKDSSSKKSLDASKIKLVFDDGKTEPEVWDWLDKDFMGMDGRIFSIPNYKNAMADVYIWELPYCIDIVEEIVPHNYDGSYKVTLYYDGVEIGSQVRVRKACINEAIKLFKDYGGEKYLAEKGMYCYNIDHWQDETFNYYGCGFGTMLETILVRYYMGMKYIVGDLPSMTSDIEYDATLMSKQKFKTWSEGSVVGEEDEGGTLYAVRYKQIATWNKGTHISPYFYDEENKYWISCAGTGGTVWDGHLNDMPTIDFYTPIYPN